MGQMEGKTSAQIKQLEKDLGLEEFTLIKFKAIEKAGGEPAWELHARI